MKTETGAGSPQDTVRRQRIEAARETWIDRLIDLSRRNNLLFYRPLIGGTIDIPDGNEGLENLLAGKTVPAQSLLANMVDRPARILNIARKALENQEEKGLNTLYLCVGFASWSAEDGGRDYKAPIIMIPVEFKQRGRDQSAMDVELAGEPGINPVLLHILSTDFDLDLTPEEILCGGTPPDSHGEPEDIESKAACLACCQVLAKHAGRIRGFALSDSAVIGNFAFAKLAMVNDLKESDTALELHDAITAIAGDNDARAGLQATQVDVDPHSLDLLPPDEEFCVVEADSSQQSAIGGIVAGQCAVVHGPPGTGKSQTITNLIATLVARGKTILFVAEKRAALEVVQRRLQACGLDHLAIDLHGAEQSPRRVMERIARTLNTVRNAHQPHAADLHRQFCDRRVRLNAHEARMHTLCARTGKTVYAMQGELLRLPAASQTSLRWRGAELQRIGPAQAGEIRDLLHEAAGFEALFLRSDPSPWTGARFADGASVEAAIDAVQRLTHECWPALNRERQALKSVLSFTDAATLAELSGHIELLREVHTRLETFLPEAFPADLQALLAQLQKAKGSGLKALWLKLTDSAFKTAFREVLRLRRGVKASIAVLTKEIAELLAQKVRWTSLSDGQSLPSEYAALTNLEGAFANVSKNLPIVQSAFGESDWNRVPLDALEARTGRCSTDSTTPYRLLRLTNIEDNLAKLGVKRLIDELRGRKVMAAVWAETFQYAWLNSALDELAATDLEVKGFVGEVHNHYVEDFKRLDIDRLKAARERVIRAHAENAIAAMNAHPEQQALVKQEAAKSRRHKPLRTLFREAGDVLTAVCPCWMASPLSVSQLIDRSAKFDYVIFDEASQVLPEDAIPSIMRGKFVVVAGDNKQLPPTGFFSVSSDEDGENELVDGYESLLDMMLPFVKSFHLDWHYRSHDEALIAFSNHHIYDDRLVTFPGPGGPPALRHVLVEGVTDSDGQEESSGAEVSRVVALAIEHAQQRPDLSLGVITMGIKHAMRIQAAMDHALKAHPELHAFFDTERAERFFIKNLERVQGDERDSIIMSIGYGKDRGGNLPLRFGPILAEGGRRRLNVAVTRARESMTVVSSFTSLDIDPAKVRPGTGLEFLRNYLQYAASEGKLLGPGEVTGEPMNDFEADVYDTLTSSGMKLVPQVGCSQFRVDFGVCRPDVPGRFVLAIECDGASYHSSYTARDRDRLRQQQLENLGWHFHRIWSTDWFLRKHEEVERTLIAVQQAIAAADSRPPVSPSENSARDVEEVAADAPDLSAAELTSSRSSLFPPIPNRGSITEYTRAELRALYDWVVSDGKLRSHDELADEMFAGLPFARKGTRIEAVLRKTIADCEAVKSRLP
ncbi:MAG TPA: AAA domain-containing protein [Acidobacteriaceae bacterium]